MVVMGHSKLENAVFFKLPYAFTGLFKYQKEQKGTIKYPKKSKKKFLEILLLTIPIPSISVSGV